MATIEDAVAAELTDPSNAEVAERAGELLMLFTRWETCREFAVKERKRTKEKLEARLAAFKEAMEVGHQSEADQILKLSVCEQRWQDLEEARAERKDVCKAAVDAVKSSEQKIRDLLAEMKSPQLGLFTGSSSTIDNPPREDDDDDDDSDTGDGDDDDHDDNNAHP